MNGSVDNLIVLLPGGYVNHSGAVQQDAELVPMSGREEELLTGDRRWELPALVTTILSRCVRRIGTTSPVSTEVTRKLLVADRQYLLLKLYEATFGALIRVSICCPWADCGRKITVSFFVNDVPIVESEEKGTIHTLQLSSDAVASSHLGDSEQQIAFRLPNGEDQEIIAPVLAADEPQAQILLLQRCIQQIGSRTHPDEDMIRMLSPRARIEIEQRMEAVAPSVELTLESECPECRRDYSLPFDLQRFFFAELRSSRNLLYREVHYLAYHYHWSEAEIMRMSRQRRRTYIEVLATEIERMNDAL